MTWPIAQNWRGFYLWMKWKWVRLKFIYMGFNSRCLYICMMMMMMGLDDDGIREKMGMHGKQILKGNQKKLPSFCHHHSPPAQDMVSATWFHTPGKRHRCWHHLYLLGDFAGSHFLPSSPTFSLLLSSKTFLTNFHIFFSSFQKLSHSLSCTNKTHHPRQLKNIHSRFVLSILFNSWNYYHYCFLFLLLHFLFSRFACPVIQKSNLEKFAKIWDEIWSDLALWDVDVGGSYFNTEFLHFSSPPPPPIASTKQTQQGNQ